MKEIVDLYESETGCIAKYYDEDKYNAEFVHWLFEKYNFNRRIANRREEKIDELQDRLYKLHNVENEQADEIDRLKKIIKYLRGSIENNYETDSQHHY